MPMHPLVNLLQGAAQGARQGALPAGRPHHVMNIHDGSKASLYGKVKRRVLYARPRGENTSCDAGLFCLDINLCLIYYSSAAIFSPHAASSGTGKADGRSSIQPRH